MGSHKSMNALESAMDPSMLYLDVLAGLLGSYLATQVKRGPSRILWSFVFLILVSRVIVDLVYYYGVSKRKAFGGTLQEMFWGLIVWILLACIIVTNTSVTRRQACIVGISQVVILFAVARVTGWG